MKSRPVKRQKRHVTISSDLEREEGEPQSNTVDDYKVASTQSKALEGADGIGASESSGRALQLAFPTFEPQEPSSKPPNNLLTEKKKLALAAGRKKPSLYSFFNVTTQNQNSSITKPSTLSTESKVQDGDSIQDDDSGDEIQGASGHRQRPKDNEMSESSDLRTISDATNSQHKTGDYYGGQKYSTRRRHDPSKSVSVTPYSFDRDSSPWVQRYPPLKLEELAVHKKKVLDVRIWLDEAINGKSHKRLLVLRGPSGAGKTATVEALSRVLGFDLVEWKNPVGTAFNSDGFVPLSAQFEEFVGRSGRYGSLRLKGPDKPLVSSSHGKLSLDPFERKIILIEDFPHSLSFSPNGFLSFRNTVLQFLAGGLALQGLSDASITPIVMIISEYQGTSTTSASRRLTAHGLLGPEILRHPKATVVSFNSVAPTILSKALELTLRKEACMTGRKIVPGKAALNQMSELGDLRSAITSLEFLCLRAETRQHREAKPKSHRANISRTTSPLQLIEGGSIETITGREARLDLFHAVGKVVHNKRKDPSTTHASSGDAEPPEHLSHLRRQWPSELDITQLAEDMNADLQTFIAALHENYVLSCQGDNFVGSLNGCIDSLSDADILGSTVWGDDNYPERTESELLRQKDISFHTAVKGLLFELPFPVKRLNEKKDTSHDWVRDSFKMLYPVSMQLWKEAEVVNGLIDRLRMSLKHEQPALSSNNAASLHSYYLSENGRQDTQPTSMFDSGKSTQNINTESTLILSTSDRVGFILDQLPYVAKMQEGLGPHCYNQNELQFVVGVGKENGHRRHAVGDLENDSLWESESPTISTSARSSSNMPVYGNVLGAPIINNLIVSDDDIEDDDA